MINKKFVDLIRKVLKGLKQLQKVKFEKIILWVCFTAIIAVCIIQCIHFIQKANLFSGKQIKCKKVDEIMFYTGESANKEINQIFMASDHEFSYDRSQVKANSSNIWVKFKLGRILKDYDIIYSNHSGLDIDTAYFLVNGKWSEWNTNDNFLNSYVLIPENYDADEYVYLKLESLNSEFNSNLFLNSQTTFYHNQNLLLLFRIVNITIVLAMLGINLILYIAAKEKKYIIHSLFLFSMFNVLIQVSGLQRLIFGMKDLTFDYLWASIASFTGMYFIYSYFDIKKLNKKFMKAYQLILIADVCLWIALYKLQNVIIIWPLLITICVLGILAIMIAYFSRQTVSCLYLGGAALLVFSIAVYIQGIYGILPWNHLTANIIYQAVSIEAVIFTVGIMREMKFERSVIQKLEMEATTDKLTGLFNRNYFEKIILPKVVEYEKNNKSISLFILDIDRFKKVNDTYGHNVGDVILSELANVLIASVREQDYAIRWGGEEFIVILFDTNIYDASVIAEKTREMVESHEYEYVKKITISIGVTQKHSNDNVDNWVKKADEALYKSKQNGRNRVSVCYSDVLPIKIKWRGIFECDNYQINTEHKELVSIMNDLIEEWSSVDYQADTFLNLYEQLLATTTLHFKNEEMIISKKEYPFYENHKQIHAAIVAQAVENKELITNSNLPSKVIEFLIDVVVGHMITEDINYYKYL